MSVTIKDIARRAGVSHSTVSRALNGRPVVAPETAERVRRIAAELGYVPSAAARSLKTKRSRVLGVIVNRVADPFYSLVLDGIQDVLQAERYSLFLASSNNDPDREREVALAMAERRVEGLIVCSSFVTPERRQELARSGGHLVLVHNRADTISPYSLYHDDREGGRVVAQHLIGLGHRRLAYLGNARGGRVNAERQRGFCQAAAEAGLALEDGYQVLAPEGTPQAGMQAAARLLELSPPPTAIVCYNDMLAIGVLQALHRAGWRVPQDCSVVGFDDIDLAAFTQPPLTTYDQPKYRLGTAAAEMMLGLMNGEEPEEPVLVLRGKLRLRQSAGPPPA